MYFDEPFQTRTSVTALGRPDITTLEDIPTWTASDIGRLDEASSSQVHDSAPDGKAKTDDSQPSKFPVNEVINSKVCLFQGKCWRIRVEACVNSCSSSFKPAEEYMELYSDAGPGLAEECGGIQGGCRTGEARMTSAYNLPCKNVIHTVSPRYATRYQTAAENSLCHCYRACLELAIENQLRTVAVGCVHLIAKAYPRKDAAHVALRTVRRCLEHWGDNIDTLVLAIEERDWVYFKMLMPLYFPRTEAEEAHARRHLPASTGNEFGEAEIEERDIRIAQMPKSFAAPAGRIGDVSAQGGSLLLSDPNSHVSQPFITCARDPDSARAGPRVAGAAGLGSSAAVGSGRSALGGGGGVAGLEQDRSLHEHYLARAASVDVEDIGSSRVLFRCGEDFEHRPVVVMVGAHLDPLIRCGELDRFVLFAVKQLHPICRQRYSLVYFHTEAWSSGTTVAAEISFLRHFHSALGPQHSENLKVLYVVHPSFALRTQMNALSFFGGGISSQVWRKAVYVDRLAHLFQYIPSEQLYIPDFVYDYDKTLDP